MRHAGLLVLTRQRGLYLGVGVVFVLAPSILGFTGLDAWYYWANGAVVLFVVGMHKPESVPAQVAVAV